MLRVKREEVAITMADDLSSDQREFLDAACGIADRFNDFQVDEEALTKRLA